MTYKTKLRVNIILLLWEGDKSYFSPSALDTFRCDIVQEDEAPAKMQRLFSWCGESISYHTPPETPILAEFSSLFLLSTQEASTSPLNFPNFTFQYTHTFNTHGLGYQTSPPTMEVMIAPELCSNSVIPPSLPLPPPPRFPRCLSSLLVDENRFCPSCAPAS